MLRRALARLAHGDCVPGTFVPKNWGQMEKISVGANLEAYATGQPGHRPVVILLPEMWGVTDQMREHAGHIAGRGGLRVVIPDLYKGSTATTKEEAEQKMSSLDLKAAIAQVGETAKYMKAQGYDTVAAAGMGMGGALAIGAAAAHAEISCAVSWYGVNFDLFTAQQLKNKAIQAHFGKLDTTKGFSDPEAAFKLDTILDSTGQADSQVYMYEGVGHAYLNFMADPYPDFAAREAALGAGYPPFHGLTADVCWSRTHDFLYRHLHCPTIVDHHRHKWERPRSNPAVPTVC